MALVSSTVVCLFVHLFVSCLCLVTPNHPLVCPPSPVVTQHFFLTPSQVADLGKPLLQELQAFQSRLDILRSVFQVASMQSNVKPPIRVRCGVGKRLRVRAV